MIARHVDRSGVMRPKVAASSPNTVWRQDASTAESHGGNLLLLTWTAGMLDGLSYLRAHVFTANRTGNIVLLGIHLVQKERL